MVVTITTGRSFGGRAPEGAGRHGGSTLQDGAAAWERAQLGPPTRSDRATGPQDMSPGELLSFRVGSFKVG